MPGKLQGMNLVPFGEATRVASHLFRPAPDKPLSGPCWQKRALAIQHPQPCSPV